MVRTLTLDENETAGFDFDLDDELTSDESRGYVVSSLGYDPDELFDVPEPNAFNFEITTDDDETIIVHKEWIEAPELEAIGEALIERHADTFVHLKRFKVAYYWQKEGGLSSGRARYGDTLRPSGLLKELTGADFVVWIAANYTHGFFESWRIEAAIYHQLLHTTKNSTTGGPKLRPHQFEGFGAEITHFGFWNPGLKVAGKAAQQLPLFDQDGGSE